MEVFDFMPLHILYEDDRWKAGLPDPDPDPSRSAAP